MAVIDLNASSKPLNWQPEFGQANRLDKRLENKGKERSDQKNRKNRKRYLRRREEKGVRPCFSGACATPRCKTDRKRTIKHAATAHTSR